MKEIHTVSITATNENDQRFILSCILTYLFPINNKSNKTNKYIKLVKQKVEGGTGGKWEYDSSLKLNNYIGWI